MPLVTSCLTGKHERRRQSHRRLEAFAQLACISFWAESVRSPAINVWSGGVTFPQRQRFNYYSFQPDTPSPRFVGLFCLSKNNIHHRRWQQPSPCIRMEQHNGLITDQDHYIGIDVGTGSARACIIDSNGNMKSLTAEPIGLWQPEAGYYVRSTQNRINNFCL